MSSDAYRRICLPSLPHMHKAVHDAISQIESDFTDCFNWPLPSVWRLDIEKEIWKQIMLDQNPRHLTKKHAWYCDGEMCLHAENYGYVHLRKLLRKHGGVFYEYYGFSKFHHAKYGRWANRERCTFYSDRLALALKPVVLRH